MSVYVVVIILKFISEQSTEEVTVYKTTKTAQR